MKKLKYILFLFLIGIIGSAIYVAVQPNEFDVTRTQNIKAPVDVIYNNVTNFKNWETWSSWIEENPEVKITVSDENGDVNNVLSWENQDDFGAIKTIETSKNTLIQQQMQFGEFPPSDVSWKFIPNDDGSTDVSWVISSKDLPFDYKFYSVFKGDMKQEIGSHLERSLEKLDQVVVNSMKVYSIKIDGITEYGGGFYMYKTTSATGTNISQIMDKQYSDILLYMANHSISQNGMPFTIYHNRNAAQNGFIMSQAIPVQNKVTITGNSEVLCGYIPKTRVLKATLTGDYTYLGEASEKMQNYLVENNMEQSDVSPFEIYQNDPLKVPNPANWLTEIYIPIKE